MNACTLSLSNCQIRPNMMAYGDGANEREQASGEFRGMTDSQHKPTLVPNTHSFELAIVLEFRECLKRILGCATEHDTFVDHLQRRKRHHDVFRADAQEAAN